jgi:hypothetical protein
MQEATPGDGEAPPITPPEGLSDAELEAFAEFTDADLPALLAEDGGPFRNIPVLPDNLETLTRGWLIRWAEWVAAGRPEIDESDRLTETPRHAELDFNPALHPRDPDTGQFVERPFDLPDGAPDFGERSVEGTLEYLDNNGAAVDAVLDPDTNVTVDGVPNDATSLDEIPEDDDGDGGGDGGGNAVPRSEIDSFKQDLSPGDRIQYDDGSESPPIQEIVEDGGTVAALYEDGFVTEETVLDNSRDEGDGETSLDQVPPNGDGEADSSAVRGRIDDIADGDAPDFQKKIDISDELESETGITSRFDDFSVEQARTIAKEVARLDANGDTDDIQAVRGLTQDAKDLVDGERNPVGAFMNETSSVELNTDLVTDEKAEELGETGYLAEGSIEHIVAHEFGHAVHKLQSKRGDGNWGVQEMSDEVTDAAGDELSTYAATSPNELVAEAFAVRARGGELPEPIATAYKALMGEQ